MAQLDFDGLTKSMAAAQLSTAGKQPQSETTKKTRPTPLSPVHEDPAEEDDVSAQTALEETHIGDSSKTAASDQLSEHSGSTASFEGEPEEDKVKRKAKKAKDLKKQWEKKVKARHPDYLFTILEEIVPKQIVAAQEQHQACLEVQSLVQELKDKVQEK